MQTLINIPPSFLKSMAKWPKISTALLSDEPSLCSCSEEAVKIQGGPLANIALKHIQDACVKDIYNAKQDGLSAVVDVRVQNLMPGMYPSVPGWHCDAVPRDAHTGQPWFEAVNPRSFHVSVTVSDDPMGVSNTEYVMDPIHARLYQTDKIYRELHEKIEKVSPMVRKVSDGIFTKFTSKTIHRAAETHRRGWRMFVRFSMYYKPHIENKKRQQPIYLLSEPSGW